MNPALRGCQNGVAVLVGRQFEGQTGRADIGHNLIDLDQKGAVLVDNAGSYAHVHHNEIVGVRTQPTIAPNGVEVSRGAGADVDHNEITGNSFAEHDCHDDSVGLGTAGTANFWIKDHGLTENRPGLCKRTGAG